MTHLVKAEPRGLFDTKVPERPNRETGNDMRPMIGPAEQAEAPLAVAVVMTPDDARRLNRANYPEYLWPSVSNLPPRTRGKHY